VNTETIRKLIDVNPSDLAALERVFGLPLLGSMDAVVVLRQTPPNSRSDQDEVPPWCNVLEGFSDEDLAEFDRMLEQPVKFGRS